MAENRPRPVVDRKYNPEIPKYNSNLAGLQARLLLGGDVLNPSKDVSQIDTGSLENRQNRDQTTYNHLAKASYFERDLYWQPKENTFEARKEHWKRDMTDLFFRFRKFYKEDDKGKTQAKILSKIGIDVLKFDEQTAENLYNRFFTGDNKTSDVKKFVAEVVQIYGHDYSQLMKDLPTIQWVANIFGKTSAEVLAQLIDAEIRLTIPAKKEELVRTNNTAVNNKLRINDLKDDEKRLLWFVWKEGQTEENPLPKPQPQPQPPTGKTKLPGEYHWKYQRLASPNRFPASKELVQQIFDPHHIAAGLKNKYPQKYGHVDTRTLAQVINQENLALKQTLEQLGIKEEELQLFADQILKRYEQFVNDFLQPKYGITLPKEINRVQIFPISDKTLEYYHPEGQAFAFVNPAYPVIFLNMERIIQEAKLMRINELGTLGYQKFRDIVKRLLDEINPHEYTHLVADIAYWYLYKKEGQTDKITKVFPGKLGLEVAKPKRPSSDNPEELEAMYRGTPLMEAVTVELTNQWARSFNNRLDINAYAREREVLHALEDSLMQDYAFPRDEAFKKFVYGYFSSKGFRQLAKDLSNPQKSADGKLTYQKPHLLSIVYALMEYEYNTPYNLTLAFIKNSLNDQQKQEMITAITNGQIQLVPGIKKYLLRKLGVQVEENPKPDEHLPAFQQYIKVLRDPTNLRQGAASPDFLIHKLGFMIDKADNRFHTQTLVNVFGDRYKAPIALYEKDKRAYLILKPPYQENGQWKIKVYDPKKEGQVKMILDDYNSQGKISPQTNATAAQKLQYQLLGNGIMVNQLALDEILNGQYDFTINDQIKSKLAKVQDDDNSAPYASLTGVFLLASKHGATDFKKIGIPKFLEDFGIKIP